MEVVGSEFVTWGRSPSSPTILGHRDLDPTGSHRRKIGGQTSPFFYWKKYFKSEVSHALTCWPWDFEYFFHWKTWRSLTIIFSSVGSCGIQVSTSQHSRWAGWPVPCYGPAAYSRLTELSGVKNDGSAIFDRWILWYPCASGVSLERSWPQLSKTANPRFPRPPRGSQTEVKVSRSKVKFWPN